MKCIILCAGYATRLYPLTEKQPKALLSVGKNTILGHIMENVEKLDEVDEIFIVTNDRFFGNFKSWLKATKPKKAVELVNNGTKTNEERLGAVGDMHLVMQRKNIKEDVLLIAGDNLFDFSLKEFITFFKKNGSSIALYDMKDKSKAARRLGVAMIDSKNKITGFEEKPQNPKSTLAATCCYALKKESIGKLPEYIKSGRKDNPGDFIAWLRDREDMYGFTCSGNWFDIGSFESLEDANKAYKG